MGVPRPTRWALARVTTLGMVGAWVIPMPWQHASEPLRAPPEILGPATLRWLEEVCGRTPDNPGCVRALDASLTD